jgi:hypothetical protein
LVSERTQELEHANQKLREESHRKELAQSALAQAQKIETVGQLAREPQRQGQGRCEAGH